MSSRVVLLLIVAKKQSSGLLQMWTCRTCVHWLGHWYRMDHNEKSTSVENVFTQLDMCNVKTLHILIWVKTLLDLLMMRLSPHLNALAKQLNCSLKGSSSAMHWYF